MASRTYSLVFSFASLSYEKLNYVTRKIPKISDINISIHLILIKFNLIFPDA